MSSKSSKLSSNSCEVSGLAAAAGVALVSTSSAEQVAAPLLSFLFRFLLSTGCLLHELQVEKRPYSIENRFIKKRRKKVVAASWGTELLKFLATKNMLISVICTRTRMQISLFFYSSWCIIASKARN